MTAQLSWPLSMIANQQILMGPHETLVTSTTPVSSTKTFNGFFVTITAIGADHFVAFDETASDTSAIVPSGATLQFNIPNGDTTVSVRTVSGAGRVSIHAGI